MEESLPQLGEETVRLELPGDSRWVSLLRLTVAGIGDQLNLATDTIDDLRLAVTEACRYAMATRGEGPQRLSVTFRIAADELEISLLPEGDRGPSATDDDADVSLFVVRAVVDDLKVAPHGELVMRKRVTA